MRRLTILVGPVNTTGHVNACAGTCSRLPARNHRVIFVVEEAWRGKLTSQGYEEFLYSVPSIAGQQTADHVAKMFKELGVIDAECSRLERLTNLIRYFSESPLYQEKAIHYNQALKQAIGLFKPDLIITDENGLMPAIYYSNIPWIRHYSTNPLFFYMDPELPPGGSGTKQAAINLFFNFYNFKGLPLDDRSKWSEYQAVKSKYFYNKSFNDFIETTLGYPRYPNDQRIPQTHILTIYATPEEWNYPPLVGRSDWFNIEVFNKPLSDQKYQNLNELIPENFLNSPSEGKLIYVSLGSMGSIDLEFMRKLIKILGTTRHKYIVSKGPLHQQIELESNQWGDRYLPQLAILPHVDAVLTHGGNNTVTEVFALGKPMLLLPMFTDQFDNATRLQETGWARTLDPYTLTADELINELEALLADEQLLKRLKAAAQRIQSTDRHGEFGRLIESLVN